MLGVLGMYSFMDPSTLRLNVDGKTFLEEEQVENRHVRNVS